MKATVTTLGSPLQYIPIRHSCGDFEMRLTRWNPWSAHTSEDPALPEGFIPANSPCATCDPMGRVVGPNFQTLEAAQTVVAENNRGRAATVAGKTS